MNSLRTGLLDSARQEAERGVDYCRQLFELQHSPRYRHHIIDIARVVDGTLARRGKTKNRLIEMVKALNNMFKVTEGFVFRHYPQRFDAFGWRETTRAELMKASDCTEFQVRASLRELEDAGFLSRRHPQIGPNRRALLVRLNVGKVYELLEKCCPGGADESVMVRVADENILDSSPGNENE